MDQVVERGSGNFILNLVMILWYKYPDAISIACNIVVCKLVTDFMMIMMVVLYSYLFFWARPHKLSSFNFYRG